MKLDTWKEKGQYHTVLGHEVFTVEAGTGSDHLLILHGYPSSAYDFLHVLEPFGQHYHTVVHDHLGFGLSDKPLAYSYSLIEQTDMALALWAKMGIKKGHIVAHDYGTSIATELVARQLLGHLDFEIQSLTLANGSMHIEMAQLRPIQRLLRHPFWGERVAKLTRRPLFLRNMKKLWGDPSRIQEGELETLWELLMYKEGRQVIAPVTRYLDDRRKFWHRWIGGLQQTKLPIHVLWATEDPVAVVAMADTLHHEIQHSKLSLLHGLGHYPMLEDPATWAKAVLGYLKDFPRHSH
ncbi:MAG: alpha/beta hydrolase [Bacteroidota bacterium]